MGVAPLSKVTIIAPRSDYAQVAKTLAQFSEFHPLEGRDPNFDPAVQELTVRAVRLFAQADQAVKDLAIPLMPGELDIVFRGVKVPRSQFDAKDWNDLLGRLEHDLLPIVDEVRAQKILLQKVVKEETDTLNLKNALEAVSGFSADLGAIPNMKRLSLVLAVVSSETLKEFKSSLNDLVFLSESLNQTQSLVLIATPKSEEARVEKSMKLLEVKPLTIQGDLPQNPAEAFKKLGEILEATRKQRAEVEAKLAQIKEVKGTTLLAARELSEEAREMLDEARISGGMKRLAVTSGYIPSRRDSEFQQKFGRWIVQSEKVKRGEHEDHVPTLIENSSGVRIFELITTQQGTPGGAEEDPTPLVSLVFPVFFGMMFGDFGHGLILTFFALLIRQRGTGSLRQWGNLFLAAGISSTVFGVVFGEFFGFSLHTFIPIPALLEVVSRPIGGNPILDPAGIQSVLVIAILIGIAHIATGLGLNVYQAARAHESLELLAEKLPAFTMYLSGVGFGLAFIGAGYSFNVLKQVGPAPLLGIPNNLLGEVSLFVVVVSMIWIMTGRGLAIAAGKLQGESIGGAIANGGIEVFERISQFLANTISYVRLAIMLLIHASLLLAVNELFAFPIYIVLVPIVIFNILIIVFEVLIVYIQDLRLHIYEFFTKFYGGTGTPFKRIYAEKIRARVNWL